MTPCPLFGERPNIPWSGATNWDVCVSKETVGYGWSHEGGLVKEGIPGVAQVALKGHRPH